MLAIAAFHDYEIWQMDVKTAFLNGKLAEDVYMNQPEGFVSAELVVGIFVLMRRSKSLASREAKMSLACMSELVGV